MREYPLRVVKAMAANGCSLESIEDFIEGLTHLSEEGRSALWLVAWTETRRRVDDSAWGELTQLQLDLLSGS